MGCFLVLLLSRCFLSLSWVLSGTPSNSLGVFGTFLGSLLGLSRGSWGLSWAFLALLGLSWAALLAYLVLFWTLLGCSWASLFEPLGPKGGQAATRCPKTAPKVAQETPKGAKTVPQKCNCRVFFGVLFLTLFGNPFRKGSWTPGPLKSAISLGRSFKNAASPRSPPRAKKDRKSDEKGFQKHVKKLQKWGPKMGPVLEAPWGALLGRSWDYDTGQDCNNLPRRRPGEG